MISEEDFAVASLAKLVGSELNVIDHNTVGGSGAPATRIHPRQFINNAQRSQPQKGSSHVVRHQGMSFHAGVDESYVQSLVPDPISSVPQPVQPVQTAHPASKPTDTQSVAAPTVSRAAAPPAPAVAPDLSLQNLEKTLKSLDKTLKSLDKNQKLLLDFLTKGNLNTKLE